MANTPKKKDTKKKTTAGAKPGQEPLKRPIRREIGAVCCLFLGIFSFIGYFAVDAWFINFFCAFVKGIVGWGYYIFPPALLLASFTLGFHRGRPVILRLVSVLLLPVLLGAFTHLLFCKTDYLFESGLVGALYASGKEMTGGGVVAGLLSMGLEAAFSVYGAVPVLLVGILFFGIRAVGLTPAKVINYYKNKPKREYEYLPEPEPEQETPLVPVNAPPPVRGGRRRRNAIDIPIDDDTEAAPPEPEPLIDERVGSFFNSKPRVKTPDQLFAAESEPVPVTSYTPDEPEPEPATEPMPIAAPEPELLGPQPTVTVISDPPPELPSRKIKPEDVAKETLDIAKTIESQKSLAQPNYQFPPVGLLRGSKGAQVDGREEISLNSARLESTIKSFGVSASITDVTRGPTVTRYDLELEAGVKLTKLTNLSSDLALSLGVSSVRISPIPDKISTVGIEVPNKLVSTVYLRDIIDAPEFKNAPSKLSFAIGKDIAGNAIVGNIAKLPHMLIAGTTGSGKSVCMNSLILSLLYKANPDEVRLIMIDPKMVELGIYNGIPHLYIPVVTDPKKAAGALQWAVVEMLKRYRLFSEEGVRDLAGYNAVMRKKEQDTMPQVVIVIDELADLMLVASKEVEESICRVAQMGRASGMHLIIATQRPSADVITGLMKANIPSRIAFAVASALESRIILDAQGAEKLIGAGDMLYSPLGAGKAMRVQGTFVTDEEREQVIGFVKNNAEPQYSDEIIAEIEKASEGKAGNGAAPSEDGASAAGDYDEMLEQAVDVILEVGQASVSMLQRRLKLGYSRAARLVDQMEELGYVGPFEGAKPRQILITKAQWQQSRLSGGPLTKQGEKAEQLMLAQEMADIEPEDDDEQ